MWLKHYTAQAGCCERFPRGRKNKKDQACICHAWPMPTGENTVTEVTKTATVFLDPQALKWQPCSNLETRLWQAWALVFSGHRAWQTNFVRQACKHAKAIHSPATKKPCWDVRAGNTSLHNSVHPRPAIPIRKGESEGLHGGRAHLFKSLCVDWWIDLLELPARGLPHAPTSWERKWDKQPQGNPHSNQMRQGLKGKDSLFLSLSLSPVLSCSPSNHCPQTVERHSNFTLGVQDWASIS